MNEWECSGDCDTCILRKSCDEYEKGGKIWGVRRAECPAEERIGE